MNDRVYSKRTTQAAFAAVLSLLALLLLFPTLTAESQGLQFGTGWAGQYWNNADLSGAPVLTLNPPAGVNFDWGTGQPDPAVNADNWSARFSSIQLFNQGTYEFIMSFDDGMRVFLDSVLIFDQFNGPPATNARIQQSVAGGTRQLRVEFRELTDRAFAQFAWQQIGAGSTPGFATVTPFGTPAPTAGPSPTPTPSGPQASISGVRGLALRTGPYVGASFITTITPSTTFTVLGRNRDEGIYNWYYIQVGERRGWASGRFLTVNVPDINQIPVIGSEFDNIDNTPTIGAIAIPRAVMNVRRRPSPRTERIGSIPWGGVAELIGRTVQAGQNRWLHVRYTDEDGRTVVGWIDARWVTVQGELFNVPIR